MQKTCLPRCIRKPTDWGRQKEVIMGIKKNDLERIFAVTAAILKVAQTLIELYLLFNR
jgi:hypothetical protein